MSRISGWRKTLHFVAVGCIVLLAAYLRLSNLDIVEFKSDEAVAVGMTRWYIENHQLPLIGLKSSVGVFNGPAFVYLMSIPLVMSRDPVFATGFVALLNVLAVAYGYKFTRDYFGSRTALLSSLFFATSPWAVTFSRKIWCQDVLPIFTILFFASLFSVAIKGRGKEIVLAFLWLSVLIQLHLAALAFVPLLVLATDLYRKYINLRYVALGIVVFLASFSPYLYWETTNDFYNIRTVIQMSGQRSSLDLEPVRLVFELIASPGYAALTPPSYPQFMAKVAHLVWTNSLEGWLLIGGVVYLMAKAAISFRDGGAAGTARYVLLLLWLVLPVVFYLRRSFDMQLHYLIVLFPMPFIAIGLLLDDIIRLAPRVWEQMNEVRESRTVEKVASGATVCVAALIAVTQVLQFNTFMDFIQKEDVQVGYGIPLRYQMKAADLLKKRLDQDEEAVGYVVYREDTYAQALDCLLGHSSDLKHLDGNKALAHSAKASANYYLVMDSDSTVGRVLREQAGIALTDSVDLPGMRGPIQLFKADKGFSLATALPFMPLEASFESGVRLQGYALESKTLPGGSLKLKLYWKVERALWEQGSSFAIFAHLVDSQGRQRGGEDGSGYASREWQVGDEFVTWHEVLIAKDVPSGQSWVEVGLYDRRSLIRSTLFDKEGKRIGNAVRLGPVRIGSPEGMGDIRPEHTVEARIGDGIVLQGYDLAVERGLNGEVLRLTLYWRAIEEMRDDYVVFTHLLDDDGRVVSQDDAAPKRGAYPTSLWEKGEVVKDEYRLRVPIDRSQDSHRIELGMYTWPDVKRLEVYDAQGRPVGDRLLIEWDASKRY